MVVTMRLYAMLRELAGADGCALSLAEGASGRQAADALAARFPRLAPLLPYARLAVNLEYQPWDALIRDGDELSVVPPVSGG